MLKNTYMPGRSTSIEEEASVYLCSIGIWSRWSRVHRKRSKRNPHWQRDLSVLLFLTKHHPQIWLGVQNHRSNGIQLSSETIFDPLILQFFLLAKLKWNAQKSVQRRKLSLPIFGKIFLFLFVFKCTFFPKILCKMFGKWVYLGF